MDNTCAWWDGNTPISGLVPCRRDELTNFRLCYTTPGVPGCQSIRSVVPDRAHVAPARELPRPLGLVLELEHALQRVAAVHDGLEHVEVELDDLPVRPVALTPVPR